MTNWFQTILGAECLRAVTPVTPSCMAQDAGRSICDLTGRVQYVVTMSKSQQRRQIDGIADQKLLCLSANVMAHTRGSDVVSKLAGGEVAGPAMLPVVVESCTVQDRCDQQTLPIRVSQTILTDTVESCIQRILCHQDPGYKEQHCMIPSERPRRSLCGALFNASRYTRRAAQLEVCVKRTSSTSSIRAAVRSKALAQPLQAARLMHDGSGCVQPPTRSFTPSAPIETET